MPTRELLSPAQRAQFLSIPAQMSEQILARYYTLSSEDLVRIRRHRRSHNKLGFAVQLAYLRFPGRTWTASEEASPLVVSYIANQLKVNPVGIVQYATEREATRFEHLAELQKAYGFRQFTARDYRELSAWLMPLALSQAEARPDAELRHRVLARVGEQKTTALPPRRVAPVGRSGRARGGMTGGRIEDG